MLDIKTIQPVFSFLMPPSLENHREMDRLLAAAVINKNFCNLLLGSPEQALELGFQGETFIFAEQERNLLLSIRSDTLADFAGQLASIFDQPANIQINLPIQSSELIGY